MGRHFYADVRRNGAIALPVRVTGFRRGSSTPFVALHIGAEGLGAASYILSPEEARRIADTLREAADHSEPCEITAADLGLEAL
jgi:hypothetical protein